jgi:hypothetical protein
MRDQIVRVKGTDRVPILLVGNKVDLDSQREVPTHEGLALAQQWSCPFVEERIIFNGNRFFNMIFYLLTGLILFSYRFQMERT